MTFYRCTGNKAVKPNVFAQLTEPTIKKGIWLKTDKTFEKIKTYNGSVLSGTYEWSDFEIGYIPQLPKNNSCTSTVYNNIIHILYENGEFYKLNGTSWVQLSTLPIEGFLDSEFGDSGRILIYNDEIHILGGGKYGTTGYGFHHYKWNGSSWIDVSTLPYKFIAGAAVVYNNEIHIIGAIDNRTKHYKWNGSSWLEVSVLPFMCMRCPAIVYNNEIHIFFAYETAGNGAWSYKTHYKFNGNLWSKVGASPCQNGRHVCIINNEVHVLFALDSSVTQPTLRGNLHYKYNANNGWTCVTDNLKVVGSYFAVELNDMIVIYSSDGGLDAGKMKSYKPKVVTNLFNEDTFVIIRGSNDSGKYKTELITCDEIEGENSILKAFFDDAYLFQNGIGVDEVIPTYYGDGNKWVKFKN